jgi:transposase
VSKVEVFEQIRLAHRDDGLSIRALADRFKVHRRDVRAALLSAVPPERKRPVRVSPVTGEWRPWIKQVLLDDRDAPVKQRHTAKRIRDRLAVEKHVVISPSAVREVVVSVRAEIAAEQAIVGSLPVKGFVPQTRLPGKEAEVDWGQFQAVIGGVPVTLHLFAMWSAFATCGFHRAYANEAQESFTDGHVRAFARFDGVPLLVRYDNLKTAVVKILKGRDRIENQQFIALRSHYGFSSFFCEPGIDGAHEKGGVEGDIGRYRRNYLTPVPTFDTLADLNAHLEACDANDAGRWVHGRAGGVGSTAGGLARLEQGAMWPLPSEPFTAVTRLTARVDTKARVCVRQSFYSVPARLVGQRVTVQLGAETVIINHDSVRVAAHVRAIHRKTEVLDLDHYLELLWRKPGALPSATALVQARASGRFRPEHQQLWDLARRRLGDPAGTRVLCDVLLLHRNHTTVDVIAGITAALAVDNIDPAVIAVETRRAVEHQQPVPTAPAERQPDLTTYDSLLGRTHK